MSYNQYRPKPIDVEYDYLKVRERVIPPDPAQRQGIKFGEARSMWDDYRAMMPQRTMQYPEYYKEIPSAPRDRGHVKWWIASVPYIAPVQSMMDGGAINVVRGSPFDFDTYKDFDLDDMMQTAAPRDQTFEPNRMINRDIDKLNAEYARNIKNTRGPVYEDSMRRFIRKAAETNSLPSFRSQLLQQSDVDKHVKRTTQVKNIMAPHLKRQFDHTTAVNEQLNKK